MLSPLRYPGSKSDFAPLVDYIVRECGLTKLPLYEPYAGSAAVSIGLVASGAVPKATILERDPLIYAFWKSVFNHTDELIVNFQDLPITLETWHEFQKFLKVQDASDARTVDLGLAGLFFNRANFSGILNGGPIGGKEQKSQYTIDCRTNKDDIIARILAIAAFADKFEVLNGDALDLIVKQKKRSQCFFYIDPPYFNKGESLYRYYYRHGDHKRLAAALKDAQFKWVLSYDVHHVIEFLYEDLNVYRHVFRYSAHSPKHHEELLISNFVLPSDLDEIRRIKPQAPSSNSNHRLQITAS